MDSQQCQAPISPLAVVGISCRLPGGANDTEKLWEVLSEGTDTWTPVPDDRFNENAFYHPSADDPNGTNNHKGGHFIDTDLKRFDTTFFRISPQQAASMDPQQRILLEMTYEALENAGISREQYKGSNTGVFGALFITDFDRNLHKDTIGKSPYALLGFEEALLTNRISHSLDLHGPSLTLDTGCSGGLVAFHQACNALRSGDCDTAVVVSSNITLSPDHASEMSSLHFLNDNGRCYPFDVRGNGYGRGEGFVVFVLKSLAEAVEGRYPVRTIVRSTAVNQDGYTPNGITYPSGEAQESLIRQAYQKAGLRPQDVAYVEAHGTGTVAGDSQELSAISNVFTGADRPFPLYVGSIKGNIGHTENTSGLASVLKSILMLDHKQIPPLACFETPKPDLPLTHIRLPTSLLPFPQASDITPRISVNCFGYGGTNSHAILEDPPREDSELETSSDALPLLFQFSANCKLSLLSMIESYRSWLQAHPKASLVDLSYTLRERRTTFPWRWSCVANTHAELIQHLAEGLGSTLQATPLVKKSTVFVFTGQGAQWIGMGKELMKENGTSSVFRDSIRTSTKILLELGASWNLEAALLGTGPESELINTAELAQPVTTALQGTLLQFLPQGVKPDVVVGHSSGEVAAAYAAGYLPHRSVLTIAFHRGFMAQTAKAKDLPAGGMMSVGLGKKEATKRVKALTQGKAIVACINSPSNVTISGDAAALDELSTSLVAEGGGIFHRRLFVDTAYHSHHMQAVAEDYRALFNGVDCTPWTDEHPYFVSTVTGAVKSSDFNLQYWIDNLVSPVQFCDAIQTMAEDYFNAIPGNHHVFFVEVGPHPALAGPVRQSLNEVQGKKFEFDYGSVLQRKMDASTSSLTLLGRLFERDYSVAPTAVSDLIPGYKTAKVSRDLPSYAWDHSVQYWNESRFSSEHRFRRHRYHDLLGMHIAGSVSIEPQWRHAVSLETLPWLADHVIDGLAIFPGSGYLCMAIEGIRQLQKDRHSAQKLESIVFRDVSFARALVIPTTSSVELQMRFKPRNSLALDYSFSIATLSDGEWSENCNGLVEGLLVDQLPQRDVNGTQTLHAESSDGESVEAGQLYEDLKAAGNSYGPAFAAIKSYKYSATELQAEASIMIPDVAARMRAQHQEPHLIHPTTLDAVLHSCLPIAQKVLGSGSVMPVHLDELLVSATSHLPSKPGSELQVETKILSSHFRTAHVELSVTSDSLPVLTVSGAEVRKVGGIVATLKDGSEEPETCFEIEWEADQDFLRADDLGENRTLDQLLAFIAFKSPGLSVLDIEPSERLDTVSVPDVIEKHRGSVSFYDKFERSPAQNGLNGYKSRIEVLKPNLRASTYDVALISAPEWLEAAASMLKPNGILISVQDLEHEFPSIDPLLLETQLTFEDKVSRQSIAVLRPSANSQVTQGSEKINVICPSESPFLSPWVKSLVDSLPSYNVKVENISTTLNSDTVLDIASTETTTLIIEDQLESIISDNKYFKSVTSLLRQRADIVWITSEKDIRTHQATGVMRTAHAENDGLNGTIIHTGVRGPSDSRFHKLVAFAISKASESKREREYRMLENGTVMVPRLRSHQGYTNAVEVELNETAEVKSRAINDASRPVELCFNSGQSIDSPCFAELEHSNTKTLHPEEIQIAVESMSVTKFYRSGRLGEYVGTVVNIGSAVDRFSVGDPVVALGSSIGSSHPFVPQSHAAHLPNDVPSEKAAALLLDTMAAVYSLQELVALQQSDTILVHGADSATGRAAIAVAKAIGVRVTITAADDEDAKRLQEKYDVLSRNIFVTRPSFTRLSAKQVFGQSLSAIIRSSENSLPAEILSHLKPSGSIVTIDSSTGSKSSATLPIRLPPNASLHRCSIDDLLSAHPEKISSFLGDAVLLIESLSLDGLDILIRNVSETPQAFKLMESNACSKAILQIKEDSLTSVKILKRSMWEDEDASFVVSGGLGDLGQRYLRLLAHRGAKSLITLSRGFLPTGEIEDLEELERVLQDIQPGCRLHCVKCDITSAKSMDEAAKKIHDMGLPPVRGVIQSAAALRDSTLETMSLDDYLLTSQIKIDGSLNLYNAFSSPNLDFFILLSSIASVVGSSGQANYNAGNATQDIIAQVHKGGSCHFTSLNIGWVSDAHLTIDNTVRMHAVRRAGLLPVGPDALYKFFDHSLASAVTKDYASQIVIGIQPESLVHSIAANGTIRSPMYSHVFHSVSKGDASSKETVQTFAQVAESGDFDTIVDFIARGFTKQLAHLIYADPSSIDRFRTSLLALGLDSLVAIELRNWIQREFAASMQSSEIFTDQTVYTLAEKIAARSQLISELTFEL